MIQITEVANKPLALQVLHLLAHQLLLRHPTRKTMITVITTYSSLSKVLG